MLETKNFLKAGVMGSPIKHSLSPLMHNYWFNQGNINGSYVPILTKPADLEIALGSLQSLGFSGCNLTIPLKEIALNFIDELDEVAKIIGAVNCVTVKPNGTLHGTNYDWLGFINALKYEFPNLNLKKKVVSLIGAGGSSRAICYGLLKEGVSQIRIVNRTRKKAEILSSDFGARLKVIDWEQRNSCLDHTDLLVNTTNQGMNTEEQLDLSLEALPERAIVYDIIYNPLETPLLKEAKNRGNKTLNGLSMLVHQAIPAWSQWFGITPEISEDLLKVMKKSV
ncbi:MAG: shikimate dehydrogenase [Paracoccaceae bacterium]|mgnify:FL=1